MAPGAGCAVFGVVWHLAELNVCHEPLPLVLSWLALFLSHALVLHLGCMLPGIRSPILDGFVCHAGNPGPSKGCGLKQSLIDLTTIGPTGTPLCFLSSLRSPSRSGAHEPGVVV